MAAPTQARRGTPAARVVGASGRSSTASVHNRALAPVPAPERAPRPAARPPLRLVDDARLRAADRRRRARLVAVVGSILAAGIFFLLAAFNAMLVTGQSRIDDLQKRVQQAQAEYSANRLQVAELEAPGHIADVAKNKLGMVPPSRTTYLTPSRAMAAQVQHGQDATASASADGGTPWADVKPYLGPTP